MRLVTPVISKYSTNAHIEKNLTMFEELGIPCSYISNNELLTSDLSKYDVIYLNWFENIDGGAFYMPILRYLRRRLQLHRIHKSGLKIMFCKHNKFPHNPRYRYLTKRLYKQICDMADVIVAFNDEAEFDLHYIFPTENYASKIIVIPPVNYVGVYKPNPDSSIYEMVNRETSPMVIGCIGKLLPYKNVELVIRAAEELKTKNIVFLIAGATYSEEYRKSIQSMVEGKKNVVALLKHIPDEDMYPLLEIMDILLMPYDTESASNSGTGRLAFSYGRTAISPDIASMNLLPDDLIYKYHYSSKKEHYDKMMEQIIRAYTDWSSDPNAIRHKGELLLEIMKRDYSEETVRKKYKEIFDTMKIK